MVIILIQFSPVLKISPVFLSLMINIVIQYLKSKRGTLNLFLEMYHFQSNYSMSQLLKYSILENLKIYFNLVFFLFLIVLFFPLRCSMNIPKKSNSDGKSKFSWRKWNFGKQIPYVLNLSYFFFVLRMC